jgi:hypothetical protein
MILGLDMLKGAVRFSLLFVFTRPTQCALHVAGDIRLPVLIRQLLESTIFFLCAFFVLLYVLPYSLAVIFVALLVTAFVLGLPHR